MCNVTYDIFLPFIVCLVSVLLTVQVERFSVSRMWDNKTKKTIKVGGRKLKVFNRPGVAGAVLQTASRLIQ